MSTDIKGGEFHLLSNQSFYGRILTRCPHELVTDQMILAIVRNNRLALGDVILVQSMDHAEERLLAECEYRVVGRSEKMANVEQPDGSMRQFMQTTFDVRRVTDWKVFATGAGRTVQGKAVWNVGRGGFVIEVDGQEVGFEKDKATAHKIAAGELPLPAEAA